VCHAALYSPGMRAGGQGEMGEPGARPNNKGGGALAVRQLNEMRTLVICPRKQREASRVRQ